MVAVAAFFSPALVAQLFGGEPVNEIKTKWLMIAVYN